MGQFRNRILEVRTMKARELLDHEGNWRLHPDIQKDSLVGVLQEIGKADVLKAYPSARAGGRLVIYDGHLRKKIDPDEEWQVAITDLTDKEADKMLLLGDPLAGLAETDGEKLQALLAESDPSQNPALRDVMLELEAQALQALAGAEGTDYSGMKIGTERDTYVEVVLAISEHEPVERAIEVAREAFNCDRGEALAKICESYLAPVGALPERTLSGAAAQAKGKSKDAG